MLDELSIDPDRMVFFGCMLGALVLVIVNMAH
jgi:preprotein translocase subunit Sec61beta